MTPGAPGLSLEVTLTIEAGEIISGAAVPLTVVLHNTAAAGGAFVHSPQADCPFVFTVEPEKGGPFEVSLESYRQHAQPDPPPPRQQEMAPLGAGASLTFSVDLAGMRASPLKPGRYRVSAVYLLRGTAYRSAPIAVVIVAPRPRLLELARSGNRVGLGSAMVHLTQSGAPLLYQRESVSGNPALGVYRSRKSLREPTSIAISTDAEGAAEPRWVGWMENSSAAFLHVWGDVVLHATESAALDANARLVSPGWTLDDGSVIFLAASPSHLSLITIANREKPHVKAIPVSGGITNLPSLRAGFFKTPEGHRRLLVVWAADNRLMCSLVDPQAEAAQARELVNRPEPLVALDIESVNHEGALIIDAVFASQSAEGGHLVRVRAGEATQTTAIPGLREAAAGEAIQWHVLAGAAPVVGLQAGARHVFTWSPNAGWRPLYTATEGQVSQMRLVLLETPWAVWADSLDGLHYRELAR
jgi:hypothetical protein